MGISELTSTPSSSLHQVDSIITSTPPPHKMRATLCLLLLAAVADVMSETGIRNKRSLVREGDCSHACEADGSCKVRWIGSSRSGGTEASCFSPEFGRSCFGSVPGCRDCSQVCGDGSSNNGGSNNSNSKGGDSSGQCPGDELEACIAVCPGFSARVFGACVAGCAKRCSAIME